MTIQEDIQKLDAGTLVELYVVDATAIGGDVVRLHSGVNGLNSNVIWQGNEYIRFPVEAIGFDLSGKGQLPQPKMRVANISGLMSALMRDYDDLIGAKVTRKRTFAKYLDAVNFPGGVNPSADAGQYFPDDIYFIHRKAAENKIHIDLELAAPFDLAGVALPRRQVVANVCSWRYRSAECGYAGGAVADINDVATADLSRDRCGKRLSSCKLRFGANAELPYGGFPATSLIR